MKTFTRFNMNHFCKVKLTEEGRLLVMSYYREHLSAHEAEKMYNSKVDKAGYYTEQLHEVVSVFSNFNSFNPPFYVSEFYLQTDQLEAEREFND